MPQQYRTTSAIRDNNAETFLSQVVSNPFQGLTPETPGSNGATIARRRLLLQFPHFDTLTAESLSEARTRITRCWRRLEKRFTDGLMLQSSYTWSRFREKVAPLNPWEDLETGSARSTGRTASRSPASPSCRSATGISGVTTGTAARRRSSAAGSSARSTSGSQACRWSSTRTPTSTRLRRSARPHVAVGQDASGQDYGVDLPIFDTTCFYTLNGQPFSNAAGQVVTFQATEIGLGQSQHPHVPDHAAERAVPGASPARSRA